MEVKKTKNDQVNPDRKDYCGRHIHTLFQIILQSRSITNFSALLQK